MEEKTEDQEKIIYQFEKNERETVKLRTSVFKGKEYVDLRLYIKGPDGDEIPTKKGVNLPIEKISELKKAISKLK
jgi:hypothetical protein